MKSYFAAKPTPLADIPDIVCNSVKLPFGDTENELSVLVPGVNTYKNFELLLIAPSPGLPPVVPAIPSSKLISPLEEFELKEDTLLLAVFEVNAYLPSPVIVTQHAEV